MHRLAAAALLALSAPIMTAPFALLSAGGAPWGVARAAAAPSTAVDCAAPADETETAICADPSLKAMDAEAARLFGIALDGAESGRAEELKRMQRNWAASRASCAGTPMGARDCALVRTVFRIHDLRISSKAARADEQGSTGPVTYRCEGMEGPLGAVFVTAGEGAVGLQWAGAGIVLPRARAASGSRYAADWWGGATEFWIKGREAQFTAPGAAMPAHCEAQD